MKRIDRVLIWSLIVAILIHAWILGVIPVPKFNRSMPPLEVSLAPMPPEVREKNPPRSPQKLKPESSLERRESVPKLPPVETGIPDGALPERAAIEEGKGASLPPSPAPVPEAPKPRPKTAQEERLTQLPPVGEIDYEVSFGSIELPVARGTLRWQLKDGRYNLRLEARTVGIGRLLKSNPVIQVSEGRITPFGLEPQEYRVIGRASETDEAIAQFDWVESTLLLSPSGTRYPLTDGAQDLLSFFFQFSLSPPETEGATRFITNARKLEKYSYELTERTSLNLPIGHVDTLHVSRLTGLNEDSFDIWLGEQYHLLPLQIRFYARGRRLTLYAKEIRVSALNPKTSE